MITVLFFGPVAERVGKSTLLAEHHPGQSLQSLCDELAAQYPQAFEIVCFAAINGTHVRDLSQLIPDNSEVAFMAKFSGG